jgi:hypothetical protein
LKHHPDKCLEEVTRNLRQHGRLKVAVETMETRNTKQESYPVDRDVR